MTEVPNRAPWMNVAVGILTIISPFAVGVSTDSARISLVITGIVIAVVAIVELVMYAHTRRMNYWPAINIIAGIWLLASSQASSLNGLGWSNIALGVMAIVTAIVSLSYERLHATHGLTH